MYERYRAFRETFRSHMSRHRWPRREVLRRDFSRELTWSHSVLPAMKRGELLPEKYTGFLLQLLLRAPDDCDEYGPSRRALLDFVREHGVPPDRLIDFETCVCATCLPPVTRSARALGENVAVDFLSRGASALADLACDKAVLHYVQSVRGAADLERAVQFAFLDLARTLAPGRRFASPRDAARWGAAQAGRDLDGCVRDLATWLDIDPWSVVLARLDGECVGMTGVFPVTGADYDQIRAGARPAATAFPDVKREPWSHLVLELCAEDPRFREAGVNPTRALVACLFVQIGAISRCHKLADDEPLRVLSYAGTPENRCRLSDQGFVPLGVCMPGTNVEIMERVFLPGSGGGKQWLETAMLHMASRFMPAEPPDHSDDRMPRGGARGA